jgi:hypothetical protein
LALTVEDQLVSQFRSELRELLSRRRRQRWEALPVEERRDHLARAHAYVAEHQKATEATVTQRHARWSEAEDGVLIARADVPAPVLAAELGRTLHGVYRRRDRLRERGLLL